MAWRVILVQDRSVKPLSLQKCHLQLGTLATGTRGGRD
jgi:hypothetical protein